MNTSARPYPPLPDCGGILWETDDQGVVKFRCHVGHKYSVETLYSAQEDSVESALWSALRVLTEKGILSRQLARQMSDRGNRRSAQHFERRAEEVETSIRVLRELVTGSPEASDSSSAEP